MWPVFMGIYGYDFLLTFWFEWWLLTGKIPFRWPYVSYLMGRYSVLTSFFILNTINSGSKLEGCDARVHVLTIVIILGHACASFNLAIRTITIWQNQAIVFGIVMTLILSQWGILLMGAVRFLRTQSDPRLGCLVITPHSVQIILVYSMNVVVDVVVLVIGVLGLTRGDSDFRMWRLGDMRGILFAQGMSYFLVTSVVNAVSVVFAILNLNTVMDIMLSVPALVVSTIASCRCVTFLIQIYKSSRQTQTDGIAPASPQLPGNTEFTSAMELPRFSVTASSPSTRLPVQEPEGRSPTYLPPQYARIPCPTPLPEIQP
ncbi:hypothetical protein OE88DRAFT_1665251 [Heliocybe sulcata]|uniref:Transmembrane protein n=1 Tax=Heliocybe sulcata TaxID=5364 RepID=A0A5C3MQJ9_9AGAM|nr:hypothetical protein OE88DRAFT_1665251 [Heliocybe sulcata]